MLLFFNLRIAFSTLSTVGFPPKVRQYGSRSCRIFSIFLKYLFQLSITSFSFVNVHRSFWIIFPAWGLNILFLKNCLSYCSVCNSIYLRIFWSGVRFIFLVLDLACLSCCSIGLVTFVVPF